jgi:quercetin dioxygenase-like cupin family protein
MRQSRWSLLLSSALVFSLAGTVLATPGSGLTPSTAYRGTLSKSVHVNIGDIKFQTKGPVDLVDRTITFAAGATSGWHSHPGVVLIVVASGSLVRYRADCSSEIISAGEGFVESGDDPGLVRNEGTVDSVTYVTFIAPAGTAIAGLRIDKNNPGCSVD